MIFKFFIFRKKIAGRLTNSDVVGGKIQKENSCMIKFVQDTLSYHDISGGYL